LTRSSGQIAALLLSLCLVVACQGETTTPTALRSPGGEIAAAVTDNVVASLKVIPDSQMVFAGDQFQVTAQPKNKAGQVLDKTITWTVGNTSVVATVGSVGPSMTFKALKAGNTSVKATVDGKSRSSKVVVRSTSGAKVVVTPADATVASGATVQFVAKGVTKAGESAAVNVTWTASTGAISSSGVLTAGATPGTHRVIATSAFGAADTSIVTVTAGPEPVAAVILVPATASVTAGETIQFEAYGRTGAGDSVPVPVTYTATGGTIAGNGLYTPGGAAGIYRVVATSAAGIADTSEVTVAEAPIARVTLLPDIAASRPGQTTKFVATVWNTAGDSVPEPATYETTCGTITGAGVFTAPLNGTGACLVTASVDGKADTTEVVLLTNSPDRGVPFGIYDLWASGTTTRTSGVAAYTSSHDYVAPGDLVSHIAEARVGGIHVLMAMTGGSHDRYKTAGVFDLAKWQGAMDAYNTPSIQDAVAEGVADGTVIGNAVMDEPQQSDRASADPSKSWGPAGTMTKARVDGLCGYVKAIFPTLPVGVGHDPAAFEPDSSYRVCEFLLAQLADRKGSVTAWRDVGLALTARDGMAIIFSMNLLNGGAQDKTGAWDCPGTGGLGTREPNCRMTPEQVRDWGKVLGRAGCALLSWRYDAAFLAKPENQSAISDVAITLSSLPRTRCTTR
jgi:hypothetical protein